jgi:predicted N-acyltransferase
VTRKLKSGLNPSLRDIPQADWDACAHALGPRPRDPFTTHRFLLALEESSSVGPGTGWQPLYLTVHQDGQIIGCAPLYGKSHSQGEYIFDFNWADAFTRAGGQYYPKFQIAVPFTPATGPRFLAREGFETVAMPALVQGAIQVAAEQGVSSLHVTFCTEDEAIAGAAMGLLRRTTQQFHWENHGFETFADFLTTLTARKRKNIRRERDRGAKLWRNHPSPHRRSDQSRTLGRLLAVLPRYRPSQMGHALPDPRIFRYRPRDPARRHDPDIGRA